MFWGWGASTAGEASEPGKARELAKLRAGAGFSVGEGSRPSGGLRAGEGLRASGGLRVGKGLRAGRTLRAGGGGFRDGGGSRDGGGLRAGEGFRARGLDPSLPINLIHLTESEPNLTSPPLPAGSDTTVSALEALFLGLTCYPDVVRTAQAQLDAHLKGRFPDFGDREHLPYITAILKETFR